MLGSLLFKKPWIAALIVAVLLLPAASQIPNVEFASLRVFQNDEREAQKLLDAVGRRFVPEDILIAAYESEDVFAPKSLALARVLTRELSAMRVPIDDARTASVAFDVLSLSNVKDAFGTNAAFSMHPLIEDPIPTDAESVEHTRRRAHTNPLIAANLISADDKVAAIMIRVNPFLDDEGLVRAVEKIKERFAAVELETGTRFQLMGHAVTEAEFQTYAVRDLVRYTPVTAVVALLLCFAFTFSWWSTFALGTIIVVADLIALGVMPLIGYRYSPLSVAIAPASIILATSTVVHFMGEAGNSLYGEHRSWEVVREQVFREVIRPSFMCCLFTAIGFFSVYVSNVQAIREFGIAAAIVTGTTFVVTVCGIALWWTWWPVELFVKRGSPAVSSGFQDLLGRFCAVIVKYPAHTMAGAFVALVVCGSGINFLHINENALEYYPSDSPVRIANELIENRLAGTEAFAVVIETREPERFTDPRELAKLDSFAQELRVLAKADVVESIADQVKLMRQAVFSEDPREARIPDTQQQVRTLLAISGEERIHELLDKERRAVRISARTKIHGTKPLSEVFASIDARLAVLFPASEGYQSQIVGISKVFVETTGQIARSEIESLTLTCLAIVTLLMIMLRSVSAGLLTILPNAIPLLMVMGFMGWTGKPITVGNSMLCSIAFGVAVEDTIHLIEGYRERLRMGYSLEEAADYAFRVKAPAGIWTSIVLAAGFLAIGFASFQPVSDFGLLLSLAVTTSLFGNLIILPATVLLLKSRAGIAVPESAVLLVSPAPELRVIEGGVR